jgi:hypothetical protein
VYRLRFGGQCRNSGCDSIALKQFHFSSNAHPNAHSNAKTNCNTNSKAKNRNTNPTTIVIAFHDAQAYTKSVTNTHSKSFGDKPVEANAIGYLRCGLVSCLAIL